MNKFFLLIVLAILVMPWAFSETMFERSFEEMGYESFVVEGAQERGCKQVSFLLPPETETGNEVYAIASIGIAFGPVGQGKADVNVSLNGEMIAALSREDFKCELETSECWERLPLPETVLKKEENSLEVCIGTGNTISRAELSNRSMVGLYRTADFSGEDSFRAEAQETSLVRGEKTRISILLHNEGSDSANARIEYARPVAEDKNAFWVVEGDAYFDGTVKPGQTVEISYVIKPRLATQMTLPPASLYYENEFGETEQKFGNLIVLRVREPDRKIEAFLVKKGEEALVGQAIELMLAVKNVGNDPLYSLSVEAEGQPSISQQEEFIAELQPKETAYLPLTVVSQEAGKFSIGCTIIYQDTEASEASCQNSFVSFREQEVSYTLYIALAFAVIAAGVYLYIMKG